ncbi:MAG: hypothetical protein FWF80_01720 [Defluviitaleaceae bacterium]|nr:hypothetical protein [Defluviitaleaceae bacterium]
MADRNAPFFGNYSYALDIHEFIRNFTYFNIGEPSLVCGNVANDMLFDYTNYLMHSAFGYKISEGNFYNEGQYSDNNENYVNIIFNHLNLTGKYH